MLTLSFKTQFTESEPPEGGKAGSTNIYYKSLCESSPKELEATHKGDCGLGKKNNMIVQRLLDSVNVWGIISGNLIHHCGFRWEMGIMCQVLNKVYLLICYTLRSVCLWFHLEYIFLNLRCIIGIPIWQLTGFQTHMTKAIMIRMERWEFNECPDIQILKSRSNSPSLIPKGRGEIGVTHKYLKDVGGSDSCHMAIYLEYFPALKPEALAEWLRFS